MLVNMVGDLCFDLYLCSVGFWWFGDVVGVGLLEGLGVLFCVDYDWW